MIQIVWKIIWGHLRRNEKFVAYFSSSYSRDVKIEIDWILNGVAMIVIVRRRMEKSCRCLLIQVQVSIFFSEESFDLGKLPRKLTPRIFWSVCCSLASNVALYFLFKELPHSRFAVVISPLI